MKLFIQNQYQDAIEIEVPATAKVADIKKMIVNQINGIMVEDQVLKFRSKILLDSDTIETSGIQRNSVLELTLQKCFKIYIKTEQNQIHELDVHFTNNVLLVKKTINRLIKIAVEDQRLIFDGNELKNGDIVTEKMIKPGSTIDLFVINLKLQLNIVLRSGQIERIEIARNSTIAQFKQTLMAKYTVPIGYQILSYKGVVLDKNANTLADYNIETLSEIHFRPNDIEIFIQFSCLGRERISLRFLPVDTIGQVKDKIQAETNINKSAQQLIWNGRVLENDAILSYERVHSGSTLSLVVSVQNLKLNIQVGPEERISIDIQSTDTVLQLKTKLFQTTKIPVNQQTLFVGNTRLEDVKMLVDYGLNAASDIAMQRKDSFDILVQAFTGTNISIRVQKDDIVDVIRNAIDRRLGIKSENQILTYCGIQLQNGKLDEYQIEKGCTVFLTTRVHGGANIYVFG